MLVIQDLKPFFAKDFYPVIYITDEQQLQTLGLGIYLDLKPKHPNCAP